MVFARSRQTMSSHPELARLVETVVSTKKYRSISPDLVSRLGAIELGKGRSWKEAVKATKNKLHQVGGAYLDRRLKYEFWRQYLLASMGDPVRLQDACREIMSNHISTRERLPILEEFYSRTLAEIGSVTSVLDLACGFNPLAIPWMPLSSETHYYAYDIYTDLSEFLNEYFKIIGIIGVAGVKDIVEPVGSLPEVDVALLLKAVPCIEQQNREGGLLLLDSIRARHIVVSFPVRSLTGRAKGMQTHYDAIFKRMISARTWKVRTVCFENELAYIVTK
ncbi:MAG: 16S rRNA methyltransferase [Myxococcota bacterium]